jgi:hypothetical protein
VPARGSAQPDGAGYGGCKNLWATVIDPFAKPV